jgi:hypothetical protein
MCILVHLLLACGHYNAAHLTPHQTLECLYPSLSGSEKKYWDRSHAKGPHEVLEEGANSFDFDFEAICEDCRESEIARMKGGEERMWPGVLGTGGEKDWWV